MTWHCEECGDVISPAQARLDLFMPGAEMPRTMHYTCMVKRLALNPRAAMSGIAADLFDAMRRMREQPAPRSEDTVRQARECTLLRGHPGQCMPGVLQSYQRPEGRCDGQCAHRWVPSVAMFGEREMERYAAGEMKARCEKCGAVEWRRRHERD